MATSNTPVFDLIELSGLGAGATYTVTPGGGGDILGVVDNATYSDTDASNTATTVTELNESHDSQEGTFVIDGVEYSFTMAVPDDTSEIASIVHSGGTTQISGDGYSSDVVFLQMTPTGGGAARYFALVDDDVGDLSGITSITTPQLDWTPAGDDVLIDVDQNNLVTVCFAEGTRIHTAKGERPIESLEIGDMVVTRDRGLRPVRWLDRLDPYLLDNLGPNQTVPVRIGANAMGDGQPHRDLYVSPNHRMLVVSPVALRMFGQREVLVPAAKLVGWPGIDLATDRADASYWHMHLGTHQVILAEGAWTESLLKAPMSFASLSARGRRRLTIVSPAWDRPARYLVERRREVNRLMLRHRKNNKVLVAANSRFDMTALDAG